MSLAIASPSMTGDAILSVSEITGHVKELLESQFSRLTVEGEVSNFRASARGHLYFSLKDADAILPCVMFRRDADHVDFQLQDGTAVEATGALSVYPPRGAYQLIVRKLTHAGTGAVLALLEARKREFAAEGLFECARELPRFPTRVVVVTSPTGAAIRDVLHVLNRRAAPVQVRIVPAAVQGDAAADQIAGAVRYASSKRLGDVIMVTRGGGSIEDLLPFSDERVVRAIASSELPTISAVGHEIDWALSDFAADRRAPTPSAAAEIVAVGLDELVARILTARRAAAMGYTGVLRMIRARLERADESELRYRYRNLAQPWYQRVDEAWETIARTVRTLTESHEHRLRVAAGSIEAASPYLALERGYAVVRPADGSAIVTRASEARLHSGFRLQFHDGDLYTSRSEHG